jgi:hypothetical protein
MLCFDGVIDGEHLWNISVKKIGGNFGRRGRGESDS